MLSTEAVVAPANARTVEARPSQTLTFLFSDLKDSSQQWESHGHAMELSLLTHDEILAEAVRAHGGWVFQHRGDGLAAAFVRAGDAAMAACDIQEALAQRGTGVVKLGARIGLHTGEPLERDDNYFGPVMNRAGRVMDAAHAGQILMSRVTADLIADRPPDGCALRDLGVHNFRGLTRAEHLYQLVQPGISATFPPPRTGAAGHLPSGTVTIAFTDMAGSARRNEEIGDARFAQLVEAHSRLVRQTVAEHGGRVVKFLGDGFMLTFHTAEDGLRSMSELRARAVDAGLPTRAGLHLGAPITIGDDYIGRDVMLASRITDLAGPSEVVASEVVRAVADRRGFEFGTPRTVGLRGLDAPIRIFPVM
jgi:class 3 adenylate cyclase